MLRFPVAKNLEKSKIRQGKEGIYCHKKSKICSISREIPARMHDQGRANYEIPKDE